MPIKFTLNETIENEGITKYALSKASGVRPNTLTDICAGDANGLTVVTMDKLLRGLTAITGKQYGLEALMIYEHPTDAE